MTAKPPPLAEPIVVAKFWKNRRRDTVIQVSLSAYEGVNLVHIREHFIGTDGCMRPTVKGLAMIVRRLPELSAAVVAALEKARQLNLLPAEDGVE